MTITDWPKRLICRQCGSHNVEMVVTGTERGVRLLSPAYARYCCVQLTEFADTGPFCVAGLKVQVMVLVMVEP
jgi:hypothetical protein